MRNSGVVHFSNVATTIVVTSIYTPYIVRCDVYTGCIKKDCSWENLSDVFSTLNFFYTSVLYACLEPNQEKCKQWHIYIPLINHVKYSLD